MTKNITEGKWEKRWHPLREEWVVYSAHRNSRPWQGAGLIKPKTSVEYDPTCYLCPGNSRIHGSANPTYKDVFIFENDHPVVGMNAPEVDPNNDQLYRKGKAAGIAKVVCYDPRHNITLSQMKLENVVKVFESFRAETQELSENPNIKSVLIFENKGEAVGVSNAHPHCQIYATDFHLKLVEQQIKVATDYQGNHKQNIFEAIIKNEQRDKIRVLAENDHAIAFIPFFARYAYEVMIFPKGNHQHLTSLNVDELTGLASVFHQVVRRMDMNFSMDFPYVMSVMQAPIDGGDYQDFRMHLWLQPPYRQPGLIKYLAGPEIGAGNFMADTMPEDKAAELLSINLTDYNLER
jgi:UDPglucose--hexose-1-phosphate uridylyltransferase